MQKISPEGKPKVQLQVVLHDGNSSTFHFVNRAGSPAQIIDRDKVKELLQQLLPNFKRKVDKELEDKNRLLSDNPSLLQLYKDLVITQVITSEEFWSVHAKQYAKLLNKPEKQEIGVSGAFLADIKPQTDGCNGLKYNLTADIIECIFKTYPAVKRKHTDHVPAKLTESEFWTKFFQSHYFHRDRINAGTKDLFTDCAKIDDQALRTAVAEGSGDPLLDLKCFGDSTLEDGFGGAVSGSVNAANSGNIVHQSMIKRFNQHSIMVLNTCTMQPVLQPQPAEPKNKNVVITDANKNDLPATLNGATTNDKKHKNENSQKSILHINSTTTEPKTKKARILEKISYDDLGDGGDEPVTKKTAQLNLTKIERYLHGPVPNNLNENETDGSSSKNERNETQLDLNLVQLKILQETDMWNNRTPHKVLVSATAAVNALGELSPGGALMRGFQEQSLAREFSFFIYFLIFLFNFFFLFYRVSASRY